jgi:serine/threonine protein kinase/tetratricopeptide (TPR) repeat protein
VGTNSSQSPDVAELAAAVEGRSPLRTIGRYVILGKVAEGGMGSVFEAYDPELGRKVAIKVLRVAPSKSKSPAMLAKLRVRLLREAKGLAKLAHPNIVPIYDAGDVEGVGVYLAMEFVEGETLRLFLRNHPNLSFRQRLDVLIQACNGLAAAHRAGFVHRDFKPDNVMVGNDHRVVVLDFGLVADLGERAQDGDFGARSRESGEMEGVANRAQGENEKGTIGGDELTGHGDVLGTPRYMAPEQILGEACGASTDVYAIGLVAYEMLFGCLPFDLELTKENQEWRLENMRLAKMRWNVKFPRSLRAILARCLAYDPQSRYANASEVADALFECSRPRHAWLTALTLSLPIVALLAGIGVPDESVRSLGRQCEAQLSLRDQVWREERQSQMASRMQAVQGRHGLVVWEHASNEIENWLATWNEAHREICVEKSSRGSKAHFAGPDLELARACVAQSLSLLDATLAAIEEAKNVREIPKVIDSLVDPRTCIEIETLRSQPPLPTDLERRERVVSGRADLQRAATYASLGSPEPARRILVDVAAKMDDRSDLSFRSDFHWVMSMVERSDGNIDVAVDELERANLLARASGYWRIAASSQVELTYLRVYRRGEIDLAEDLLGSARSAGTRSLFHRDIEADLARVRGIAQVARGEISGASASFENALALTIKARGQSSVRTAVAYDDLGVALSYNAQHDRSRDAHEHALRIRLDHLGATHPLTLRSRGELGFQLIDLGRLASAEEQGRLGVLACRSAHLDVGHCGTNYSLWAESLAMVGDFRRSEAVFRESLALESKLEARPYSVLPWVETNLATLLLKTGRLEESLAHATRSYERIRTEKNATVEPRLLSLLPLVQVAAKCLPLDRAGAYAAELQEVFRQPHSLRAETSAEIKLALGEYQAAIGNARLALDSLREAEETTKSMYSARYRLAAIYDARARAFLVAGATKEAILASQQAVAIFDENFEVLPIASVPARTTLAWAHWRNGDRESAEACAREALDRLDGESLHPSMRAPLDFLIAAIASERASDENERNSGYQQALRAFEVLDNTCHRRSLRVATMRDWLDPPSANDQDELD